MGVYLSRKSQVPTVSIPIIRILCANRIDGTNIILLGVGVPENQNCPNLRRCGLFVDNNPIVIICGSQRLEETGNAQQGTWCRLK
ncbi:hypothetical protein RRG08_030262 [Elysia crispata]|uniref:Uncharacterized protein n=1 Tax=Elysia crispata TaxID=231223 RepID=A0AAE1AFQ6_9GAST|nr:hypothetical protein RRG08_030262 [Elysia crispata]